MKKVFFLFATGCALSAQAQMPGAMGDTAKPKKSFTADSLLSRWVIDVNVLGGMLTQDLTLGNTLANYPDYISGSNTGNLKFKNGMSYGADAQIGFFLGHKRNFGFGVGFMYLRQQGDLTLDNFAVQYRSNDVNNDVFRQVITANGTVKERVDVTNLNIPIVFKAKKRLSKVIGLTADVGALLNVQTRNEYKQSGSFDYSAIYQYSNTNGVHTVYDNAVTPNSSDVFYVKTNSNFNQAIEKGYNVGTGITPAHNSGTVSYTTGTWGFIAQPSVNFFLSDAVALNLGVFYMYQKLTNNVPSGYTLTNRIGEYNSSLNTVSEVASQSYGLNVGARFFLGKKAEPAPVITSVDFNNPTVCGASDGSIVLHGLMPGKMVTVNYMMNNQPQPAYNGVVEANGTVRITGLAAGDYTGITATTGEKKKKKADGNPGALVNPAMRITSQNSKDPSANGSCDGTITLYGLRTGQAVSISYNMNGSTQKFNGYAGADGSVTMTRLCAGSYTNMMVSSGSCSGNASDVTLTAPPAVKTEPQTRSEEPAVKPSTPIQFEVNSTNIHPSSYPVLNAAVKKLNSDKDALVEVDGYTDITGKAAYNRKLSLKRANAVKKELIRMGVDPKRIKVVGHGSKSPIGDNKTAEGRMQNRRAVMHLNVGD